jgi:hypothetical protein
MLKIHEWDYIQKNGDSMISIQKDVHKRTIYDVGGEAIQLKLQNDERNYVVKPDESHQNTKFICKWIKDE